jgi:Kef-type K+ transport system membrane component KefB
MNFELQLLLLLGIIIIVSKVAGDLSRRFLHQPVVFGEILAGLVMGPTLLNIFHWPVFESSAHELHGMVHALAGIGVLLLMFMAGLETDLAQMRRVGKVALWAAILGVVLPLGFGILVSRFFGLSFTSAVFVGAVLTATSVSITAQTLMEIGRLRSKEGLTILGAAIIDDVLGIIILSFVIAFGASAAVSHQETAHVKFADVLSSWTGQALGMASSSPIIHIIWVVVLMGLFFVIAIALSPRIGRVMDIADRMHASYATPAATLFLIFLFAVGAEYFGQVAAITGAYIVGIALGHTKYAERVEHNLRPFTYALFVPIFFMSIGLGADLHALKGAGIAFAVVISVVAILTKVVGCGVGARVGGFTGREAMRVGVGMVSRGEVGLIVAQCGIAYGLIHAREYAAMVAMVLVTTVITPVLLRFTFPRQTEIVEDVYESVVGVEVREEDEA